MTWPGSWQTRHRSIPPRGRPPAGQPGLRRHWGRHWLDTAGYADSAGVLSSDAPPALHLAIPRLCHSGVNANKPYDRFLHEQLAGDELTDYWSVYETADRLPATVVEGLVATGFLRMAADASRPISRPSRTPTRSTTTRHSTTPCRSSLPHDGTDHSLCPVPQSQVRPDFPGRLLPDAGDFHAGPAAQAVVPQVQRRC
ncbi:MAG: hypothetical protein Ct9H300mP1_33390 [Planctomycetaceae bacterium]|nr:MAG: hypothetical protein Ct9H300mP1_33390 [Planctomycetaceae bacterium]